MIAAVSPWLDEHDPVLQDALVPDALILFHFARISFTPISFARTSLVFDDEISDTPFTSPLLYTIQEYSVVAGTPR